MNVLGHENVIQSIAQILVVMTWFLQIYGMVKQPVPLNRFMDCKNC